MRGIKQEDEFCRLHNYSVIIKNGKHTGYRTFDYIKGDKNGKTN